MEVDEDSRNEAEMKAERLLLKHGIKHSIIDCEVLKDEVAVKCVYNRAREKPG